MTAFYCLLSVFSPLSGYINSGVYIYAFLRSNLTTTSLLCLGLDLLLSGFTYFFFPVLAFGHILYVIVSASDYVHATMTLTAACCFSSRQAGTWSPSSAVIVTAVWGAAPSLPLTTP